MIVDKIENSHLYNSLGEKIIKAFEILKQTDFSKLEPGKYDVDGDNIFYMINHYKTKNMEGSESEVHRKYIDVQYMVSGNECIGYAPLENQVPTKKYDEEGDFAFYNEKVSTVTMKPGMFAIFYPTDLHMPGIIHNESTDVVKVVIKVKV